MYVDHLIIGQGISGTLLSYYLQQQGRSVMVIDDDNELAVASKVASGVINPVTGKRLVRTWMIDTLLPFALDAYTQIGNELGVNLVSRCEILDIHQTQDASTAFNDKLPLEAEYLHRIDDEEWSQYFRFNYGVGGISPSLLVDMQALIKGWRECLMNSNSLLNERFSWADCEIGQGSVTYKGITAGNIILCNGAAADDDAYFGLLPWSKDKGEALIVAIPGLPRTHIYKQGTSIVPWHDDLFWIGATHDWKYTDMELTPAFRRQTEEHLNYWLKLPYTIVDHLAARRPANMERKPFVGLHPLHKAVGIFNGMGSKGCSVAPYFADQFARHLVHGEPLMPDVDVKRFARILSR